MRESRNSRAEQQAWDALEKHSDVCPRCATADTPGRTCKKGQHLKKIWEEARNRLAAE